MIERDVPPPPERNLDELYHRYQKRLELQGDAYDRLIESVARERRIIAVGQLILIFRYREAQLMGERAAPEPECRYQESFCGDTGCKVHGMGPDPSEPEASSQQPAADDESSRSL